MALENGVILEVSMPGVGTIKSDDESQQPQVLIFTEHSFDQPTDHSLAVVGSRVQFHRLNTPHYSIANNIRLI